MGQAKNKIIDIGKRLDGWMNVLTGIGIKNRDKKVHSEVQWEPLTETDAEELYAADDIATTIVDELPEEAFRTGYDIVGYEKEAADKLYDTAKNLGFDEAYQKAWQLARLYGGSGILMITGSPSMESEMGENEEIKQFVVFNSYELVVHYEDLQKDIFKPDYGKPQFFRFQPRRGEPAQTNLKIHCSRVIPFYGAYLPTRLQAKQRYWGDSVLTKAFPAIRNFNMAHSGTASLLEDLSVAVFKIKNLAQHIGANNDTQIINRLQLVNMSKSIARAVILDTEEEFDHRTRNVTGVKDLVDKTETRLASVAKMPTTKLFGYSPTGMGGTGRHEQQNWYDYVDSQRDKYLKPKLVFGLQKLAKQIQMDPEALDVEFKSLFTPNETEMLANRKTQADTDAIYLDRGVATPDEIAKSRFGGDSYSHETNLDEDTDRSTPSQEELETDPTII